MRVEARMTSRAEIRTLARVASRTMDDHAVPILPSRDLHETLEFFVRLGFENRGAPPEEWNYLIIGRGTIEIHFIADPTVDPFTTGGSCYLYVADADAASDRWASRRWRGGRRDGAPPVSTQRPSPSRSERQPGSSSPSRRRRSEDMPPARPAPRTPRRRQAS